MPGRDIVCIGASAGGINALIDFLGALPEVPAALFVVVHTSPQGGGLLAEVLSRAGSWRTSYARDGEAIEHGRIYVAPADHHLLVKRNQVRTVRGPRENRFRPAIDPLFRTASHAYGARVIGIVLSGGLDDGTHGLELIKRHGGIAIAQDPEEAISPSMPLSAIQNVEVDYILRSAAIAARLPQLVAHQVDEAEPVALARQEYHDVAEGIEDIREQLTGPPSEFTCPECGGTLWELGGGRVLRYRCHVGHGYTAESLLADQGDGLENALWGALRALEEHSMLRRRMADHALSTGNDPVARNFEDEAKQTELRASTIRQLLQVERSGSPERRHAEAADMGRKAKRLVEPRPGTRSRKTNR